MAQAYDFALDKIGMDIHSYSIWNDYVNFLKNVEAVGSYAENQKISAVRKVYQRGVINPMIGMETFWKDYISFEQVSFVRFVCCLFSLFVCFSGDQSYHRREDVDGTKQGLHERAKSRQRAGGTNKGDQQKRPQHTAVGIERRTETSAFKKRASAKLLLSFVLFSRWNCGRNI